MVRLHIESGKGSSTVARSPLLQVLVALLEVEVIVEVCDSYGGGRSGGLEVGDASGLDSVAVFVEPLAREMLRVGGRGIVVASSPAVDSLSEAVGLTRLLPLAFFDRRRGLAAVKTLSISSSLSLGLSLSISLGASPSIGFVNSLNPPLSLGSGSFFVGSVDQTADNSSASI
jgi:hypothetical protein